MYCRASYTVGSHFSFPPPRSLVKQPPREESSSFDGHFASRLILAWNRPFCTLGIRFFLRAAFAAKYFVGHGPTPRL